MNSCDIILLNCLTTLVGESCRKVLTTILGEPWESPNTTRTLCVENRIGQPHFVIGKISLKY